MYSMLLLLQGLKLLRMLYRMQGQHVVQLRLLHICTRLLWKRLMLNLLLLLSLMLRIQPTRLGFHS